MKIIFGILTCISYILMLFVAGLYNAEALRFSEALILLALSGGAAFGSLWLTGKAEEAER